MDSVPSWPFCHSAVYQCLVKAPNFAPPGILRPTKNNVMFRNFTHLLLLLCFATTAHAQLIWADPVFPTEAQAVTIYFDATQGTGGLANCNCDVYLHTGVITNLSTGLSDWKHVVTSWGQANAAWKMTPVSGQPNVYSYAITPSIRQYYGLTNVNETIQKMAFVFRNGNGSLEGKDIGGTDIYYDVAPANQGFAFTLIAPTAQTIFTSIGSVINIQAAASQSAEFSIVDNGVAIVAGNGTSLDYDLNVSSGGVHQVEVIADNSTDTQSRSFTYIVAQPTVQQALPAGTELGINYLSGSQVRLAFYAPGKDFAFLIGDFNNWEFSDDFQMKRTPDGSTWWIDVNGLIPNKYYAFQYVVDGGIRIGEPYSNLVLDPSNDQFIPSQSFPNIPPYPTGKTTGIASLLRTNEPAFDWQHDDYNRPEKDELIIYEMLMRDFTQKKNYQTLLDTLDYLQRLGINAIEPMPINEFNGNLSWGYDPTYHYALDKFYGTPDAFRTLVDACHERGIAIILDVVFNHAHERNPLCMLYWDAANNRPAANSPWLNQQAPHDYSVFNDFNHESPATKTYVKKVLSHWLNDYHVDGFRFDLSKGLTQNTSGPFDAGAYDATRIATLKDYANEVWSVAPTAYVILEHFAANTEEKELSDYGCMLWGGAGVSNQFLEASMGYNSNLIGASYKNKGWADPHLIAYMESHDEERMNFKNITYGNSQGSYNVKNLSTALDRAELTSVFYLSIPGPKMLWQFFETGYDFSINRCEDGSINNACRLSQKPIRWDYMANPDRVDLWNVVRQMNVLRTENETFRTDDFVMNTSGFQKTIHLNDPNMNAVVLGNFGMATANVVPNFQHTGWWYEYFTGDSTNVTDAAAALNFDAGEYRLYTDTRVTPPSFYTDTDEAVLGENFEWGISPNPTSGDLTVDLLLTQNAVVGLSIMDVQGRVVVDFGKDMLVAGQHQLRQQMALGSGLYFVLVNIDGAVGVKKLMVE